MVHQELKAEGFKVSLNTSASLMAKHCLILVKRKKFKVTTNSNDDLTLYPNLLEQKLKTSKPNEVQVADITYIETKEGWLYLAIILDLYSRKVIGWSMAKHMRKKLTLNALRMTIDNRDLKPGLIHHSDRASQYASNAYQRTLRSNGIITSMSRKGYYYDNAVAESFFATLKTECYFVHGVLENNANIFQYIENFDNFKRGHSYIGYLTS